MTTLAVYREPFSLTPQVREMGAGMSLAQMAERMSLPAEFWEHGTICLNNEVVPRHLWPLVRPKATLETVQVTFHAPIRGGDGKNPLALVASIALVAATGFIAGGGLAPMLGTAFKAGSLGAAALGAGVSLAGSLVLGALTPPPVAPSLAEQAQERDKTAGAEGNALAPNGPIPRVVGVRKIFPPHALEPLIYYEADDEVVEAIYCLAGPHQLRDVKIANAPIAEAVDVEHELREGWSTDPLLNLVTRQSRTEPVQAELAGHQVNDGGAVLEPTEGGRENALPQPLIIATRDRPDEVWLHVNFPQGLNKNGMTDAGDDRFRVPFRLRLREVGGEWRDLPELHYQAAHVGMLRATIKLIWSADAVASSVHSGAEGWVEARRTVPAQTVAPLGSAWAADSYFGTAGGGYIVSGNTAGVLRTQLDRYEARVYLDPASFPRARYEVEIKRGYAFRSSLYTSSTYRTGNSDAVGDSEIRDFFGYQDSGDGPRIWFGKKGVYDQVGIARLVSVWNEHPVPKPGLSLIAIRARNRRVERVSAVAAGYVKDWDGTGWNEWTTTSNPAPHLRDIFAGDLNADPVPADLIDEDGLVEWRQACIDAGFECNALIEGQSVAEAATIVAGCGFARPYMSDLWGVTRDYDRSAEAPVQIFTPRNSAAFSWQKAFPRVPDGFRVSFRDRTRDWELHQISVPEGASGLIEQVTYEGIDTEAAARARAEFDLRQARERSAFYSLEAPVEAIVCRRGSLVGVQHDMLSQHAGHARVVSWTDDSLTLDDEVPVTTMPSLDQAGDLSKIDWSSFGRVTGVAIRRTSGSVSVYEVISPTGSTRRLDLGLPLDSTGLGEGALVTVGPLHREFRRMIVSGIEPRPNLEAALTLVDEAPQLWAAA